VFVMAFFWHTVECDADVKKADAVTEELKLSSGIVHRVIVIIPSGHAGLMHLQIFDGLHEVYPTSPDEDFHGDNIVISFRDWFELKAQSYTLDAKYWNLDDTYSHEMIIGFGVLPKWVLLPQLFGYMIKKTWNKLTGYEEEI